jgi:hypothetical protein
MSRHADLPVAGAPAGDAAGVAPQPPATAPPQTQSFPALTQPQPAQRPAPTQSATAQHAVAGQSPLPAPTGRSPEPPGGHRAEQTGSGPTGPEENTEIIRPQAPGS